MKGVEAIVSQYEKTLAYGGFNSYIRDYKNSFDINPMLSSPQIDWVDDRLDFIGRFENYDQDWNFVCNKLGIETQNYI